MSRIKAFNAIRPNEGWFRELLGNADGSNDKIGLLQKLLEPGGENVTESWKLKKHLYSFETLLEGGNYVVEESPAIYIYECESPHGSQFGLWVLTSLQDVKDGKILKHEETLFMHQERLQMYREEVGLEASPVLLAYRRQSDISSLIEKSVKHTADVEFLYEGSRHRLWTVKDNILIKAFQTAFAKLEKVYVADGHHRLASAAALHEVEPQWITTLYVSAGQLSCNAFHKMIIPNAGFSDANFFETVNRYFHVSAVPENSPFEPSVNHRLGLFYEHQWYQLDLKEELVLLKDEPDVKILQDKILEPIFGITDPRTDLQLMSWPSSQWAEMIARMDRNPDAILFTLFPLSVDQLIQQAEKRAVLPPKSTYIEPKVPYGLLLYNAKNKNENMKGAINA